MLTKKKLLQWYIESGVDETIGEVPQNRYHSREEQILLTKQIPPKPVQQEVYFQTAPVDNILSTAVRSSRQAKNLEELKKAMENFSGCSLKATAKNTVFGDGDSHPVVMFIGEAPGADEDKTGTPFVGVSGQLLDKMISAIGLSRTTGAYISNIIPWRPPGNRVPSHTEISLCLPFIQRHIELIQPKIIVCVGGISFSSLIGGTETITKARGKWFSFQSEGLSAPIPVLPIFHPAFLLRSPIQKQKVWADLLTLSDKINELAES